MIYRLGMLKTVKILSYGQLVIEDEIAGIVKRVVSGVSVDDELMAAELIKRVGIGGDFLTQRHSLKHLTPEQVQTKTADRRMRGAWEKEERS